MVVKSLEITEMNAETFIEIRLCTIKQAVNKESVE